MNGIPPQPAPPPKQGRGCFLFMLLGVTLLLVLLFVSAFEGSASKDAMLSGRLALAGNSIGVVRIEGPINESRDIIKIIKSFRRSKNIKAIILRLDTPGGSVGASEEIYREVMRARTEDKKRIYASMGNAAASGGYYIASAAEEIFANSGTITGSIGVIAPNFNFQNTISKLGVRSASIKSGEHKDSGSPFRDMEPHEKQLIQGVVYDMYRQFLGVVLKARHKQIEEAFTSNTAVVEAILDSGGTKTTSGALEWEAFTTGTLAAATGATTEAETAARRIADGRIYTGDQALKLGLVDHIGTMEDTLQYVGKKCDLGSRPRTVERSPESDIPSWLGASVRAFWQEASRSEASIEMRSDSY